MRPLKLAIGHDQNKCPLEGKCKTGPVIYQATVSCGNKAETYTGSAAEFKERYNNHMTDFRYSEKRTNTDLAGHIWSLKDSDQDFTLKWDIITKSCTYNPKTKACMLCLEEKIHIMFKPTDASLNGRDEFFTHCRHKSKKLLGNT